MIILDTETTGLPKANASLDAQPKIIEFGAMKVDDEMNEIDRLEMLIDPGMLLPDIIKKITKLQDEDVKGQGSFIEHYPAISDFFIGETRMLAHNMPFDFSMMLNDLKRIGMEYHFPWPTQHLCSVELTTHIKGRRMKLEQLYAYIYGKDPEQKHRAMGDVEILHEVCVWMHKEGLI